MKKVNLGANRGVGLAAIVMLAASVAHAELTPAGLRCEYRRNPLGIDETRPRLSWQLESSDPAARSQRQTAYQILVASSRQALDKHQGDLWDSGKVVSNQTVRIEYTGKPLTSRLECHWKVRAWDQDGKVSAWSAPALWTMGLLAAGRLDRQVDHRGRVAAGPRADRPSVQEDVRPAVGPRAGHGLRVVAGVP